MRFGDLLATRRSYTIFLPQFNPQFAPARSRVHPHVVGNGARRSRRFNVARSPALAEYSNFLGFLTLKRPEGRAPWSRQLADALNLFVTVLGVTLHPMPFEGYANLRRFGFAPGANRLPKFCIVR